MTQNLDRDRVQVTSDCPLNQFQPENILSKSPEQPWKLALQGGEQIAKYYKDLFKIYLNSQKSYSNAQSCCSKKVEE